MIIKGYEQRQIEKNTYPMIYTVQYRHVSSGGGLTDEVFGVAEDIAEELYSEIDIPSLLKRKSFRFNDVSLRHIALANVERNTLVTRISLAAYYGIDDKIDIVHGRRPQQLDKDYEVMVSTAAAYSLGLSLNSSYEVLGIKDPNGKPIVIHLVGIFEQKDKEDLYWIENINHTVIFDPDIYDYSFYVNLIGSQEGLRTTSYNIFAWDYVLDYKMLTPEKVDQLTETIENQTDTVQFSTRVNLSNMDILEVFSTKRTQINIFLPVLLIPIIALLGFFIVMISGLVFDYDKNERTLMQSRGASKRTILLIYVLQSVTISILSLAAGIPLSIVFCRFVGSSNGFLEFVGRDTLIVTLSFGTIVYALLGVVIFLLSMLLPIAFSREDSIVISKRSRVRTAATAFERYYIDVVLLILSLAGLYTYDNIAQIMTEAGVSAKDMPMNPLLFIISSTFIFGCCLLFTRIYPHLIELLFRLGRKSWSPVIYSSLISTSRIRTRGRFLMIFLVATVSMGIFSSAAARTINKNYEDRIAYNIGADIRLKEKWKGVDPNPEYSAEGLLIIKPEKDLVYASEPPFSRYTELQGVRKATKVYTNSRARLYRNGRAYDNLNVMCVIPSEFPDIAWNRSDLYDYHINNMMNAMLFNPYAILLSEGLMEKLELNHGDEVYIGWENNKEMLNCVVYDSFKYFPTYDPNMVDERNEPLNLIVMNYELIEWMYRLEPYEVWISKEENYPAADIYQDIVDLDIPLSYFYNTSSDIVEMKNDPLVQGMNGNLTLSFIVTIIITVTGFMIYWIFDLKNRQLQMGIIRSMGMTNLNIIAMLLWEQLLLSFIPMFAGFLIGGLSASTFVPMFEFGVVASKTAPPYKVFIALADYLRIGAVMTTIILLAIVILGVMVSRLKMSQTLKLGEE